MKYFLIFIMIFLSGCYSKVGHFETLSLESNLQDSINQDSMQQVQNKSVIFYRECSKSGNAWLYTCQVTGLDSILQIISLVNPHIYELENIKMYYYPKNAYVRFEISDNRLKW
ncbi:hypothetical protein DCO58_12415 [Helicobacter saguini]|uniref:Lipoprotein n=1 Tax=Helicobacter saguini TaxID=1548018 RepID=A0A347VQL1_9HELI|nr:hypothetical protein [Helicobacter saguini]MWV60906.1 hypothetical protein [Helicobacter saguini]MWV68426.1 hypothetical protein [Helicobacter saguini]MWV70110.1 hypothetical protein [Helicobacter saguini]MWV72013.1 hypothetical protein [Helicobacter saguini]TLD93763.1 hypothetical protein LS64_008190 [Helicobacter saguini]